ncbi:uncharacterized protein LOC122387673 [Amphibalanus amphitrite]|uniref:uncharacterized protein LOC122387673 n=1 Tax=Amphibalanus amphitrite TaxID=1232801 RepID=UPI001C90DDB4|nr:uncharacterized protein LOC122387673 [Amphibalanus amphitrite]
MVFPAWPPLACLTLFVVVVIILILKFGHKCFGSRVTTLPQEWERRPSRYQYQMEVLDTSLQQPTQSKQPLDAGGLVPVTYGSREMLGQYDDEPRRIIDTRYPASDLDIIEPTPQYATGSVEAAV